MNPVWITGVGVGTPLGFSFESWPTTSSPAAPA